MLIYCSDANRSVPSILGVYQARHPIQKFEQLGPDTYIGMGVVTPGHVDVRTG